MPGQIPDHSPNCPPPSWKRTAYVATRRCGCFQGFAFLESPQQIKDAARWVSMWIKEGHNVDRIELMQGESISTLLCAEHADKPTHR